MKNFSQRDDRWRLKRLGFGTGTIGNYGCALTCYSIAWGISPDRVNEYFKNNGCFAGLNLINWAKTPGFVWRGWTYDNDKVKKAIEKHGFCIVETDFNTNPKDGSHFVVFIGDGKMIDPWDGKTKPTNSYPVFYGYAEIDPLFNPFKGGEDMPDTITIPVSERDALINRATILKEIAIDLEVEGNPDKVSLKTLRNIIGGYKGRANEMEGKATVAEASLHNAEEYVSRLKKQLLEEKELYKALSDKLKATSETQSGAIDLLEGRIGVLQEQVNQLGKDKGALNDKIALLEVKREYEILIELTKLKIALVRFK